MGFLYKILGKKCFVRKGDEITLFDGTSTENNAKPKKHFLATLYKRPAGLHAVKF